MKQQALGMIETVGYTTAVSAADAALKAANVTMAGVERVIGAGGALGVTIHLSGDVAAVTSAVQAGKEAAEQVGRVISSHVIPRAHTEVDQKILTRFQLQGEAPSSSPRKNGRGRGKKPAVSKKEPSTDRNDKAEETGSDPKRANEQ
ncbi:BMC domain-containing protein [Paludifilum halophilum]|uniref:BMC domain-containing protein n=1 Tax=Paludifilum halophilum TaxID=1642702 RepID=A0A235B9X3_9BACL|nr:hypothetical protein CHM34_04885 [Paludifilum halophilum]